MTRIVAIGAGILGASVAYHAACAGAEVVLIDAAIVGAATGAGAGIISPWPSEIEDPAWYRLAAAGARYYPELVSQLAEDGEVNVGYRRCGALVVATDEAQLARTEQRLLSRRLGAPEIGEISRLPIGAACGLFPPLRGDLAAVHLSGGARVDGRLLTTALIRAAVKRGALLRGGRAHWSV